MFEFLEQNNKQNILASLNNRIQTQEVYLKTLQDKITSQEELSKALEAQIIEQTQLTNGLIEMQDIGLVYEPTNLIASSNTQLAIEATQRELAMLIGSKQHIAITKVYRIDNSDAKGLKFQTEYINNLLIGFNIFVETKQKALTANNFQRSIQAIAKTFDKYNKKANLLGVQMTSEYLRLRLELMRLSLDLKIIKAEEKEMIKENKRRLKEQEKLVADIERTKRELEKERKHYEQMMGRTLEEAEREEIKAKLAEIDKKEADADYRLKNAKSGWIYVISNTALKTGPNGEPAVKIGATRMLNPYDRIRILNSASVYEKFIVHSFFFSEDCFALENAVHKKYDAFRCSENKHKEFYWVEPKEVINGIMEEYGGSNYFVNPDDIDNDENDVNDND